jgi:cohesin complex subunit SA-1/2
MDMSDDNTGTSESGAPASRLANNRRTSGRVKRKPDTFSPNLLNGKRKRANNAEDGREGVDMEDSEEDSEDEDSGSADDEEIKEKKRKTSKKSRSGKPASKKPRTSNGTSARKSGGKTLAHRPAARRTRARHSDVDEDAQGLYGTQTLEVFLDSRNLANADGELTAEVFARGRTAESVAAEWVSSYERHNSRAIRDLVNFVLKSSGCNLEVTEYDIEDPDHVTDKLADLQDEYQAVRNDSQGLGEVLIPE